MANDRNQNPANPNEAGGREQQLQAGSGNQSQTDGNAGIQGVDGTDGDNGQSSFVSETYETDIDGIGLGGEDEGEEQDPDGTEVPERRNDEFEKDSDEYRQNQQEEIIPDVDGEGREDETERPTTAGDSSGSNDQTNGMSGSASN